MLNKVLEVDFDGGGLLSYGYFLGENIIGVESGCLLFVCLVKSNFNLVNFMCIYFFIVFGVLKIGMDFLVKEENVKIYSILVYGGLFKMLVVG